MKKTVFLWLCVIGIYTSHAIDLKQSKITQVVNDVDIISQADQKPKPAAVDDIFSIPDILRTGSESRAELVAKDATVTRVGANTIFSFDPSSRTIDLKQGSLLFHSPHGKGGGTIHTGAATASVLGTTLIVTTTADGGMKVIDLEGHVAVKLPNNKKQKLSPGQMTFILPGNRQLAPIIVFRLDALIKNSLLVHGFGHPLDSMPLIQQQINNQLKLIKSGRAKDTGLLVGDEASPNQVEVLDPNTIRHNRNITLRGAQKALHKDATIDGSSLTARDIPTPPKRIFLNSPFLLEKNSFYAKQRFRGFAGQNITFVSPTPLTIDMAPFANKPIFDLVAAKDMNFTTSVNFNGLSSQNQLSLIAGNQITFYAGITLQANVGDLEISSPKAISINNINIINNVGALGITSGSTIDLINSRFALFGETILTAPDAINIHWSSNGYLNSTGSSDDNVLVTDPEYGQVNISSKNGSVTIDHTSIQTHYLTLTSGDGILLDASGQTLTASGPGSVASFTAPNSVKINNTDLTHFENVNVAANTITLHNVSFSGDVNLYSLLGQWHNGTSVYGYVNDLGGNTYNGNPVSAVDGFSGTIAGTGITVGKLQ